MTLVYSKHKISYEYAYFYAWNEKFPFQPEINSHNQLVKTSLRRMVLINQEEIIIDKCSHKYFAFEVRVFQQLRWPNFTQTEEFMFRNVDNRPTVYKLGP